LNNFRKYSASILLIFALFAINGAEFLHHHDHINDNEGSKCEACILNHSLNTAIIEQVFVFTPQVLTFYSIFNNVKPIFSSDWYSSSPGRAPPAVSHI
jgi:hypothetical protein